MPESNCDLASASARCATGLDLRHPGQQRDRATRVASLEKVHPVVYQS